MGYHVRLINTEAYDYGDGRARPWQKHEDKVQEVLDGIGEAELYEVKHDSQIKDHNHKYDTLIVYRTYP